MKWSMLRTSALLYFPVFVVSCTASRPSPIPAQPEESAAVEVRGTVPIAGYPDSAWFEMIVPAGVTAPRAAVAFIDRELDRYAYDDRVWRSMCVRARCALLRIGFGRADAPAGQQRVRNAGLGTGEALLEALKSAARLANRPGLAEASLVIFGFSAAGNFGATFAALHPERTIGFIQFHSHMRGIAIDTAVVARVPALSISGGSDQLAGTDDARSLWSGMRRQHGPWAWVVQPNQPHFSIDALVDAGFVMRQWTEAMIDARVRSETRELAPLVSSRGWVVGSGAPMIVSASSPQSDTVGASWLPNEVVALGFRLLAGACAPVGLPLAVQLLGSGTEVASEESDVCQYSNVSAKRDLWVSAVRRGSERDAVAQLRATLPAELRRPVEGFGAEAWFIANASRSCSTMATTRVAWIYTVAACGDAFGKPADTLQLARILRRVRGMQ